MVDEIARRAADYLEEAAEFDFGNDEDVLIRDLMLRLYLKGAYWEAIGLLRLSFSLVEMDEADELVSLLGACSLGDSGKDFLELFLDRFGICQLAVSTVRSSVNASGRDCSMNRCHITTAFS